MAECEFYASIYAESLQVTLSTHQATQSFKESSDSALPEFYAAVVVFSVKAKAYFASIAIGEICFLCRDIYAHLLSETCDSFGAIFHQVSAVSGQNR